MKLGAAEAVAINGPPSNDANGRGMGEEMAGRGDEDSFMAAVSTAYNAQSGQGEANGEQGALMEGDLAAMAELLAGEMIAGELLTESGEIALTTELLDTEATVELLAELANAQVQEGGDTGMPALSFGNPEVAALQAVMINAQTQGAAGQSMLAETAASLTSAANGLVAHPSLNGSLMVTAEGSQNAQALQLMSMAQAATTPIAAETTTTAANALTPANLMAAAEQVETTITLSQEVTQMPTNAFGAKAASAAVTAQTTQAKAANANANASTNAAAMTAQQMQNIKVAAEAADTPTEGGGQDTMSGGGQGGGSTGNPQSLGQAPGASGSFQANLMNQAAGARDVSATNLQGTQLQQAGFAKMPGIPEGAHMRVLNTNMANQTATVEVQHPSLGPIQLEVQLQDQQLRLKAITNSLASALAIGASEHALRSTVEDQGMDLQEMDVEVDREGADAQSNQQHWDEQQGKAQLLQEHRGSLQQQQGPSFAELTQSRINTEA